MGDDWVRSERAVFDGIEYQAVERLRSVCADAEVMVCVSPDGVRRYATLDAWMKAVALPVAETSLGDQPRTPIVTTHSSSAEKLALFRSLFAGREDVYAKSYYSKKTSRIGYAPACANTWRRGVCGKLQKPPLKCAECEQRDFLSLDDETLKAHFRGFNQQGKIVVAMYPLIDETHTRFLAIDFDKADWMQAVGSFRAVCSREGVPVAVERSRSGNGAHVWLFFSEPVEASAARKLGCALITRSMQVDSSVRFDSYDRLFPNQDSMPIGGFGNPIALPFQGDAMKKGNTQFVDELLSPYEDQWRFLSGIKRVTPEQLSGFLHRFGTRVLGDLADMDTPLEPESDPSRSEKASEKVIALPWATKRKVNLSPKDAPSRVTLVRSNLVYVPKEGFSAAAINKIKRLAAFGNPEFYRAQAMRQAVYGKPRVLYFGEDAGSWVGLPRGCEDSLVELLTSCDVAVQMRDERCEGRSIRVSFRGELRPEQEPAVRALLSHDTGVLVAPTAFGKTVVAANIIAKRQVSTLVLVPRATLLAQWQEKLAHFLDIDEELPVLLTPTGRKSRKKRSLIGQIGGGERLPSGIVDVALVPALFEKGEIAGEKRVVDIVAQYGMVICDECHHIPALSFERVMRAAKARYVYGLTATPKRSDGMQAVSFMQCGPVRYRVQEGRESSFARIMIPRFTKTCLEGVDETNFTQVVERLAGDESRNDMIVKDVSRALDAGGTPLVLTRRVDHAKALSGLLEARGYETMLLVGADPRKIKQEKLDVLKRMDVSRPFAIVATGSYVGEGFDDDRLDMLFLASPVAWSGLVAQFVGRLHRRREGKREVVVYDYVDISVRMLDRMYRKRLKEYAAQGYELRPLQDRDDVRGEFVARQDFLERLERDMRQATRRACLTSAEVHKSRVEALAPCVQEAVERGVEVRALLPDPALLVTKKARAVEVAAEFLSQAGAAVEYRETCPNLAIIDGRVVWYGGIGAFAFPQVAEQALRFSSAEVARELEAALRVGEELPEAE